VSGCTMSISISLVLVERTKVFRFSARCW